MLKDVVVGVKDIRTLRVTEGVREEADRKDAPHLKCSFKDLLTMIGWEYPEMFYSLPCQFNLQTFRYGPNQCSDRTMEVELSCLFLGN